MKTAAEKENRSDRVSVIGLGVDVVTYASALQRCLELAKRDHACSVSAANSHIAAAARSSESFGHIMDRFDLTLPDGMPLIWVMNRKLLRQQQPLLEDRVYGPYFMRYAILNAPAETTHFFFGGSQECLDQLGQAVRRLRPDIRIVGSCSPPYRKWSEEDQQEFARQINESAADFVWVALGGEKQERWIIENMHRFKRGVYFAIGDAFELLAGRRPFAPEWFQRHGITWLYRLLQEPRRMWKRYFKYNSRFLFYQCRDALIGPSDSSLHRSVPDKEHVIEGFAVKSRAGKSIARTNILGVGVSAINMDEAVELLMDACSHDQSGYVCVTGVHGVIESQRDPELKMIHNRSFLTVPDGMPTVWVGREQGFTKMGRVYGPDLMLEVCRQTSALNQRTEVGGQRTEDGGQRTEVGGQRTEVGGHRTEDGGQRTEVGGQRTEVGGQRTASPQACMANGQEAGPEGPTPRREDGGQQSNLISDLRSPTSDKKCFTHFLYGSTPEVLEKLKTNLERKFPGLQIVGIYSPPFRPLNDDEERELQRIVAECKPDFFWVGLSTPKQERFMSAHSPRGGPVDGCSMIVDEENPRTQQLINPTTDSDAKRYPLDAGILLGVGAAFDIHAGLLKDAPEWIKNSGLQWFYRLCQEPRRLWRRYLDIIPHFLWSTALQLLGIRKYELPGSEPVGRKRGGEATE